MLSGEQQLKAPSTESPFYHWTRITTCTFNFLWSCDSIWDFFFLLEFFFFFTSGPRPPTETLAGGWNYESWQVCIYPNETAVTCVDTGRKEMTIWNFGVKMKNKRDEENIKSLICRHCSPAPGVRPHFTPPQWKLHLSIRIHESGIELPIFQFALPPDKWW